MSDQFENPVIASEEAAAAASIENEIVETEVVEGELVAPEVPVEEEVAQEEDDFFAENEAEVAPQIDPDKIVTLLPSSAPAKYVDVDGPMHMVDLISKSQLQFAGDFQCFLNGAQIDLSAVVPGGSTVTIIGKVKGG